MSEYAPWNCQQDVPYSRYCEDVGRQESYQMKNDLQKQRLVLGKKKAANAVQCW